MKKLQKVFFSNPGSAKGTVSTIMSIQETRLSNVTDVDPATTIAFIHYDQSSFSVETAGVIVDEDGNIEQKYRTHGWGSACLYESSSGFNAGYDPILALQIFEPDFASGKPEIQESDIRAAINTLVSEAADCGYRIVQIVREDTNHRSFRRTPTQKAE